MDSFFKLIGEAHDRRLHRRLNGDKRRLLYWLLNWLRGGLPSLGPLDSWLELAIAVDFGLLALPDVLANSDGAWLIGQLPLEDGVIAWLETLTSN